MDYNDDFDKANSYAKQALARLKKLGIPMSPKFFEVWYVYYARQNPDVLTQIDSKVKSGEDITEEFCLALHKKYLQEGHNDEIVRKAGDQISNTISQVSGMVKEVQETTQQYGQSLSGANNVLVETDDVEELKKILANVTQDTQRMIEQNRALEQELDQSSAVMEDLQKDLESIRKEAMTDGLTGLSNRKSFDRRIDYVRRKSDEEGQIFTLMMLDIDHFKAFNDNYGHQVGDQVLRLVAKTLTDGIKGKDFAARYGGEEFSIILPESNSIAGEVVGNALREAIAKKEVINRSTGDKLGRITMSVGVAQYSGDETVSQLIERADKALYKAKEAGRNQVIISD